ncbi:MAG: hypothetical protein WBY94_15260 [Polyangiaceae bacterium]
MKICQGERPALRAWALEDALGPSIHLPGILGQFPSAKLSEGGPESFG